MSTQTTAPWQRMQLPEELRALLDRAPSVTFAGSTEELVELALRDADENGRAHVGFDVPGRGHVVEAEVCRVRNGISANYTEPYMRRRDPKSIIIGDEQATDKQRFHERFGYPFEKIREETFEWLAGQHLAVLAFQAGVEDKGLPAVAVAPANAGFFAFGLGLLQGVLAPDQIREDAEPEAVIYVAPPFRHTHFDGNQVVVHNRADSTHELFSYNLYPGPSAKKGVYGMLINLGEREGWVTAHCSTVRVVTPYDNHVVFMHEGASGGGKSEMLEQIHRQSDGRLLIGENTVTGEQRLVTLARGCELNPVTDDMALCGDEPDQHQAKLRLSDAENAWFVRVNHINRYGTDPALEGLTVHPPESLMFLNIDATPDSTALIWEHTEDEPGVPCPNPRVVVPRRAVPGVVEGEVTVDIRSFGVRTPPCTKDEPTYGIIGLFHILPAGLAWLWRLVAPRGHGNPSITAGKKHEMSSEGVGSYWPFATGRRVDQANLLLRQIMATTDTLFILTPNQHIGAWKVGFTPQWIAREYLARRGSAPFRPDQYSESRCPLLGYSLNQIQVEGTNVDHWFLQVQTQPEVGQAAYDEGAAILQEFFDEHLAQFQHDDLDPLGRKLIDCCLNRGSVEDYETIVAEHQHE